MMRIIADGRTRSGNFVHGQSNQNQQAGGEIMTVGKPISCGTVMPDAAVRIDGAGKRIWCWAGERNQPQRVMPLVLLAVFVTAAAGCGGSSSYSSGGKSPEGNVAILKFSTTGPLIPGTTESEQSDLSERILTGIELIRSPLVLNAALAQPGIMEIDELRKIQEKAIQEAPDEAARATANQAAGPVLRDRDGRRANAERPSQKYGGSREAVRWMRDHITVHNSSGTSLLEIGSRNLDRVTGEKVVNAVATAYLDKVVDHERNQLLSRVEMLSRQHRRREEDIRQRRAAYKELVDSVDAVDGTTAASQRTFLDNEKLVVGAEIDRVGKMIWATQLEVKLIEAELAAVDQEAILAKAVNERLEDDVEYMRLERLKTQLTMDLTGLQKVAKSGESDAVKKLRDRITEAVVQQEEVRERVILELGEEEAPAASLTNELAKHKRRLAVFVKHRDEVIGERGNIERDIQRLTVHSPELQQRKDELDRMEQFSNQLGLRLEALRMELAISDSRVVLAQKASR